MFFLKSFPPVIDFIESIIWLSSPSKVKFAKCELIIPPCGVPDSVSVNKFNSLIAPAASHISTMCSCEAGNGRLLSNHLWLILSKKDFISASNTHFLSQPDCRDVLTAPIAFFAFRCLLNP